jgi:RimJ/RimL family protein N-acetyltransferase
MKDPSFEHLATSRLLIRRFRAGDAEALATYRSDPEVARYQDWEIPYPIEEASRFIASLQHRAPGTSGTWFQFAVSLASSRDLIGDIALRTGRSDPRQAELGFTFAAARQGRGYAMEAVRSVVQYSFTQLAMHRVFARTDVRNLSALRLLERIEFRREGEFRESVWFKGEWVTDVLYAQLESEWRTGPPRGSRNRKERT